MNIGIDKSATLLEKMLDVSSVKHKVIANNIANVNTPGYKKMDVTFADQLEKALNEASPNKFDALQPKIVISKEDTSGAVRNDGNNVDMDKEVSALVKNTLSYSIYTQLLAKKYEVVKSAIEGSRG
ncbi:MAG TPA: flagellar basal body rod protein FlgB [Candidatus Wunengus sp. YC60]|uniref:flagellar basal body rod protein FlgB n=1 Tax=Candidatus Wunengus sp. YC60 TaxID=3367697 RepID=UPI004026A779